MIGLWLMEQRAFSEWGQFLEKATTPDMEQVKAYEDGFLASDTGDGGRIMTTAGESAEIRVEGILTDRPSFMAFLFGGGNTTYSEIREAARAADSNPEVKTIKMRYSSPGGSASAEWMETMRAISELKKPVVAYVGNMAASAAYGLASQAGKIVAQNSLSSVGSIGVVYTTKVDKAMIKITGENSPYKVPDPETEEGKTVILERVNAIEKEFIRMVAEGRGITSEQVIADYGKGAVYLAGEALNNRMVDEMAGEPAQSKQNVNDAPANSGLTTTEAIKMDLSELKAEHGAVYSAAVEDGIKKERARVNAHLKMGASSKAMEVAIKAVQDGAEFDATAQADYMSAFMEAQSAPAGNEADDATADAVDGDDAGKKKGDEADALDAESDDKLADAVADAVEAQLGGGSHE